MTFRIGKKMNPRSITEQVLVHWLRDTNDLSLGTQSNASNGELTRIDPG
jgi:hypothetical protein